MEEAEKTAPAVPEQAVQEGTKETTKEVTREAGKGGETLAVNYFGGFNFEKMELTLEGLLRAGVHFGHLKSRRHPRMNEYVFAVRKNISILDLSKTVERLNAAADFLVSVEKAGKPILFVGMKKQTHDTVQSLALRLGQFYVIDRWLGGTVTNFRCIRGRAKYLNESQTKIDQGELKKYTKFEQARITQELEKLERKVGGIKNMAELPGAIVIADVKEAALVVHEARKANIPVVGLADTNTDPRDIDYPIPANDDAVSSLRLIFGYIGKRLLEGRDARAQEAKNTEAEQPKTEIKSEKETAPVIAPQGEPNTKPVAA